jgi:hypothetical protein
MERNEHLGERISSGRRVGIQFEKIIKYGHLHAK